MAESIRNRCSSSELSDSDVDAAIERIAERDDDLADEAGQIYSTLTWGEGPGQITQTRVQHWLWYQLATKYITEESDHMNRLASTAAVLFDELGLHGYAAICRSSTTALVHAAFDRSATDGFKAMRKAMDSSGIQPPPLDDFAWGEVMGVEETRALAAVERALEDAIAAGELVVGGHGWRSRQRRITAATLGSDHPSQPGQSWRTAVLTERMGEWIDAASRRSDELGRLRAGVANRLLVPIEPPPDIDRVMYPMQWLLDRFGEEQPLTAAGYLNKAFLLEVHADKPWIDPAGPHPAPRTESDEIHLHRLRKLLQSFGAFRKRGRRLYRTKHGAAMAADPALTWLSFVENFASHPWNRFVTESIGLVLLDRGGAVDSNSIMSTVSTLGSDFGWRTSNLDGADSLAPEAVRWVFSEVEVVLELLGMLERAGEWRSRTSELTPAGETTVLAMLRHTAAGPREKP